MQSDELELSLHRHLNEVAAYLKQTRDATAALRYSLRAAREFFDATDACLATLAPGSPTADVVFVLPYGSEWDASMLAAFVRGEKAAAPSDVILARLRRRDRSWGVIGLRRCGEPFEMGAGRALSRIAAEISDAIHRIDRDRLLEVRARIDGKVVQQLPPKDLFYQILDGIRSLTGYDHSSAIFIYEPASSTLRLVAEQIAWLKGKSRRIGMQLPVSEPLGSLLQVETVYGFDRTSDGWRDWTGQDAVPLAQLLELSEPASDGASHTGSPPYGVASAEETGGSSGAAPARPADVSIETTDVSAGTTDASVGTTDASVGTTDASVETTDASARSTSPRSGRSAEERSAKPDGLALPESREGTMLCAPLTTRDGPIGVLKVAARHAGTFGAYEADLVQRFLSIASVAIQNSQRTETLQARMLEAVRKHAIVDLARGVSHDINNALGAVLPLVQQIQEDQRSGTIEPAVLEKDLQQIEQSLQICRRIFAGMLGFARSSARGVSEGDVRRALEGTHGLLADSLERSGIRFDIDLPESLPLVRGGQGELEQLFLNLITNARDAMAGGGVLSVRGRGEGQRVEVVIGDTGCGIPPESMPKIQEPFFTTKPHGTGLGLSTCRWIVWDMRGQMMFDSEPGRGTKVTLLLPTVDAPIEERA